MTEENQPPVDGVEQEPVGDAVATTDTIANVQEVVADEPAVLRVNLRVLLDRAPRRPLTEKEVADLKKAEERTGTRREGLALLHVDQKTFGKISEAFPKLKLDDDYLAAVQEGTAFYHNGNALGDALEREGSYWRQCVDTGTERLAINTPQLAEGGKKLTGEAALRRALALSNMGQVYNIPLWHSGFWISIKTPTEAALLDLDQHIATNKVELGKVTNGLLFSNDSVLLNRALIDFVLRHVYDSSLQDTKPETLKDNILLTDLPTLIWGVAVAVWSTGFKYQAPCVDKTGACTHIVEELLNLARLSWTDNSALSDDQRRHMARRRDKYTLESIRTYQAAHKYNTDDLLVVKVDERIKLRLRVPTLAQYDSAGSMWIEGIRNMVEGSFGAELSDRERAQYMFDHSAVSALQQYSHWVKEISIDNGDEPEIFDDESTMANLLAEFTKKDEIRDTAMDAFGKLLSDTTLSLIALPSYSCPACGAPQTEEESAHPYLIPLEVNRIFFTLLTRRLERTLSLQ